MQPNKLKELVNSGDVKRIRVMSNEGDIYLAQALIGDHAHTLKHQNSSHPLVFRSYFEAKQALKPYGVTIELENSMVYEEMGGPEMLSYQYNLMAQRAVAANY